MKSKPLNPTLLLALGLAFVAASAFAQSQYAPYITTPLSAQTRCVSVITDPAAQVVVEFDVANPANFPPDPSELPLADLMVTATSLLPLVVPNDAAHLSIAAVNPATPAHRVLTITPAAFGSGAISLRVFDGTYLSLSLVLPVTWQNNTPPTITVITPPPAYVLPGQDYIVQFSADDSDPTPATLNCASFAYGVVTMTAPPPGALTRGVTYSTKLHISDLAAPGSMGGATLVVSDGCVDVSAFVTVTVDGDPDGDGVLNSVENGAPDAGGLPLGDGNGNGTLDSEEPNVTSLPTADGSYVTVEALFGRPLSNVHIIPPTDPTLASLIPDGVILPRGLVGFRIVGTPGFTAELNLKFTSGSEFVRYYKYRPDVPSLTLFPCDATFIILPDSSYVAQMTLADNGPCDLDPTPGIIEDPSGPALLARPSLSISLLSAAQAQISWPVADLGLVLQYSTNLVPPITWSNDTNTVVTRGPLKNVTVDLEPGQRFYRLGPP